MRKLALVALMPLALASCGLGGTPNGDVMGTISNAPANQGTIRIAVLGVSFGGIANTSTNYLTVTPNDKGVYAASLPNVSTTGAFKVVAYADKNENKSYDLGDTMTKDNGKLLVYVGSDLAGTIIGGISGFAKGWNLVQGTTLVKSGTPFTGYDLSF